MTMRPRKVHPIIKKLINAATKNQLSELKAIIKAIPAFAEFRDQEQAAYQELNLKYEMSDPITIDSQDQENNTALTNSAYAGHTEIVAELLKQKANINLQEGGNGSTALIYASMRNRVSLVQYLINTKANPNIQDESNDTALIEAAHNNHAKIVALLLEAKADPTLRGENGGTALIWAVKRKHRKIAQQLLDYSRDFIEVTDDFGKTALDLAISSETLPIIELLLQHGAIVNDPVKLLAVLHRYDQRVPEILSILALFLEDQINIRELNLKRPQLTQEQFQKLYLRVINLRSYYEQFKLAVFNEVENVTEKYFPLPVLQIVLDYDACLEHSPEDLPYVEEQQQTDAQRSSCSIQ